MTLFWKKKKYQELALLHQCSRQSCAIHVLRNNQTTQKQPTTIPPNKLIFVEPCTPLFDPNSKTKNANASSVKPPASSELPSFFGDPWGNEKIRGGFSKFAKGFPFFSKHDQPFFGKFHMWPHRDSQKRELVSLSSTDSRDYWSIVLKYDSLLSSNTKYSHAKMKSTTKCLVKHGEITLLKMEIMVVWVWWKSYRPWNRQDASLLLCTSSLMTSWSKMASTLTLELWKGKLHRMYGNIYKIYDKWLVI